MLRFLKKSGDMMNPLNKEWFYRGFHKVLRNTLPKEQADRIWYDAGQQYVHTLAENPEIRRRNGAMVLPAVVLFKTLTRYGLDAETLLNSYGEQMGKRFAQIIHVLTSIPGADRIVWRNVNAVMKVASSEKHGYRSKIVSEPPEMYGVDILSCPYHELAKELGEEKAVLCICHMDKEYSQGFRHIRYDRNSAVSEGAESCEYRLRFDSEKE